MRDSAQRNSVPRSPRAPMRKAALHAAFHRAGMRLTRQRLAIYRELEGRCDHPDVEHLFKAVKPRIPQISLFTVYRTVNALESAGMIWRVATWKGHARYDGIVDSHHHFLCETCGRIDDVEAKADCAEMLAHARGCVPDGQVRRVDVMISGDCAACAAARESISQQA
ncbi:MAG: transcriptional repressor [Opitutae bacterium]|nr:transcriptional repressor [Opitutae bacterium]